MRWGTEPAAIRKRLARTDGADSAFFQSILCNSPFREWCDRKKDSTAVIWIAGDPHPRTFDLDEYAAFAKGPAIRPLSGKSMKTLATRRSSTKRSTA